MNLNRLNIAIAEAERFLERARVAKGAHSEAIKPMPGYEREAERYPVKELSTSIAKERGALRRSSMDLTRALADLRKPN